LFESARAEMLGFGDLEALLTCDWVISVLAARIESGLRDGSAD
jgi:hypothetical protein